ncbi:3-isopropylmalate dehydratase [Dactylosporangium sp. CS-047395]|uniref:LeuD/DmdB family oxidoreductase small subunit n=1 Tax=Dactylosporangium sp. CS-047395 TaxID=3239936 RepID=UPI003D919D1E
MTRVWKFGANVDTDQIVPGRYAPYLRPNEDLGKAAFIEARPEFAEHAEPGDVIVADRNFGCGSSREYAPLALRKRGIAAVVAPSFARIFYRNAINLGIPLFVSDEIAAAARDGEAVELDRAAGRITLGGRGYDLPALPSFTQDIIDAGGIVNFVKANGRFPG